MRILIDFSETKREIDGSFRICGSHDDLRHIAHQMLAATSDDFGYGWVTIYADVPQPKADTPPQPWDRAHSEKKVGLHADKG